MASYFSLRSSNFCNPKAVLSEDRLSFKTISPSKINVSEQERRRLAKNALTKQFLLIHASASQISLSKWIPPGALSSTATNADSGESISDNEYSLGKSQHKQMEFNRVNHLVRVLHETARSFSVGIETLDLARTGPAVAMAWNGVDVHAWHKHIAYQVAAYALLKAAIEVELFLSHNRCNNPSPVQKILSPNTDFLRDHIESQLTARNPKLVQWFQIVELPRVAEVFMPLFKKWSVEYAGSGVAGTIMAITCCAAIGKLGSGRISCSFFSNSIEDAMIELMNMAQNQVTVDKLHHLATEAGFEEDFLSHFGSKVLPSKTIEDIEFWIGLVQEKLSAAFRRESVIKARDDLSDKVQENSLATLALFAYLGRESRLFLSRHNIKEIDEQIQDFLSYLECGILFIYPEFSTLSVYQLLMEVIIDEIGWLDFFAAYNCQLCQERRRSKYHPIQAEKEIIFYTVFTVCYDVISGFAHYSNSTQQTLDPDLLEFLLQRACYQRVWKTTGPLMIEQGERNGPNSTPPFLIKGTAQQRPDELRSREKHRQASLETQATSSSGTQAETMVDLDHTAASKSVQQNFLKKSAMKLVAASVDVGIGTQLLFVDISDTLRFMVKKLCGDKVTKRETRKMRRTLSDIATLIPITILMLLPVSAVGHAAMFAAIKRYMPYLIPSPYSEERLNLAKQLKRTKKMEVQRIHVADATSKLV
ncbi:uncharacterized protein LOC105157667 isoform X3 [Sesamum indicum]|uniref:Uncharacterized protein LOC105157667 isoform X3 n=1 Tax=Sesamum indicum TaxID=4182 RepID=A0A6I9SXM8_SESIN|nr:uncharacterized protein LOC105157667 isoform X3 [Sesamum indicum]